MHFRYMFLVVLGFFVMGQFAVKKNQTEPNLTLTNQKTNIFFTAKFPTAKNPCTIETSPCTQTEEKNGYFDRDSSVPRQNITRRFT